MSGELDLNTLMRTMQPEMHPGTFVYCTLPNGEPIPESINPLGFFRESEGTTIIVEESDAEKAGLASQFPSRQITLTVHSSLNAVGFLATVLAPLAKAGISVNSVSAYYHDHLLVPQERADEAMRILRRLTTQTP